MRPRIRQVTLIAHLVGCMGWMGAVAAFIVLDATTVTSDDVATLRAAYIGMDLMTTWAVVPLAILASLTGVALSLGTKWGLFRHWWVVVTIVLTAASTLVLFVQLPIIEHRAALASDPETSDADLRGLGDLLLHSVGGTVVLLVITVLNVVKPRGLTRYGWRKQREGATPPEAGTRPRD